MSRIDEVSEIKQRVEELQTKKDKTAGALDSVIQQLKEEFDCSTLEEAQEKHKALQDKEKALEKQFEKKMKKFREEWDGTI